MPALIKTELTARVVWLGRQPVPVKDLVITAEPVEEMPLSFAGFAGEVHAGETRPSCSRVTTQHPRGTVIRNVRQLCIVSAEEMAAVAKELGIDAFDYAWVGASVVVEGMSRLQGPDGVTLVVDMENLPWQEPAVTNEKVRPGQGKGFKAAANGRRGVTAWVEREGVLRVGDVLTLHVPGQRAWEPGLPL